MKLQKSFFLAAFFAVMLAAPAAQAASINSSNDISAILTYDEYQEYCDRFHHQDNNNGWTTCPDPSTKTAANQDINIEEFAMQDTVDYSDPDNYASAQALMKNLVQPSIPTRIPDQLINTPAGRERILMQNHTQSARVIASDAIASVFSSRAAIPVPAPEMQATMPPPPTTGDPAAGAPPNPASVPTNPSAGGAGSSPVIPTTTPPAPPSVSLGRGTFTQWLEAVGAGEGGKGPKAYTVCNPDRYCGKYQVGELAFRTAGCINDDGVRDRNIHTYDWTGNCGGYNIRSIEDWKNNPAAQEAVQEDAWRRKWQRLTNAGNGTGGLADSATFGGNRTGGVLQYLCHNIGGVLITPSGILAAANQAAGFVEAFLLTHGQCINYGGYGRSNTHGMIKTGGYETPFMPAGIPHDCAGYTPTNTLPPAVPISSLMQRRHKRDQCNMKPVRNSGGRRFCYSASCGATYIPPAGIDPSKIPPMPPVVDPATSAPVYAGAIDVDPPRPVWEIVCDIRVKAGSIPSKDQCSRTPSYNEIMLAMTKERFLDPEYYTRMAENPGALKQEQVALENYINVQMEDIYSAQEQLNLLYAARASLKLNQHRRPNILEEIR
ncbi:MAG: hypothetical protein OXT65_12150 [Alphaproteobacteria bacterium]|nr:hypothetical protein [Alphaproteobacteria bacterium]